MDIVIRLACERATEEDFAALEQNMRDTESLTVAGRFEERTYTAIEFNRLLAEATRNPILSATVEAVSDVLRHFVALAGPRPHDQVLETRRSLISLIRAKDAAAASAVMARYLDGLQEHLLRQRPGLRNPGTATRRKTAAH
jgi:DNA-binding GntR family transcriptional regulator